MTTEQFYHFLFRIVRPLARLLYPMKSYGRENIPDGPAIICAPHSNFIDPVLIAYAFGEEHFFHIMSKFEVLKVPVLGWMLKKMGVFAVDRSNGAGGARESMRYLKSGKKVLMFPEGTRVSSDDSVAAKTGAVRIADKLGVPIIPVYVPRGKLFFHKVRIDIGRPYYVKEDAGGEVQGNYKLLSGMMMNRIYSLKPGG